MRPNSSFEKLTPLLYTSSFTSKQARLLGVSSASLSKYVKQQLLIRIGHGIYRGLKAPTANDFRFDDIVEATQRTRNGIICLSSALILYNLTDEMPSQNWIAIENSTRHRAAKFTNIIRMRNISLGKTTIKIGKVTLQIFDRERTIVDAFRYLSQETALKALKTALSLKGIKKIDIEKIRLYAKILRVKIEPYILAMTI